MTVFGLQLGLLRIILRKTVALPLCRLSWQLYGLPDNKKIHLLHNSFFDKSRLSFNYELHMWGFDYSLGLVKLHWERDQDVVRNPTKLTILVFGRTFGSLPGVLML